MVDLMVALMVDEMVGPSVDEWAVQSAVLKAAQ